MSDNQVCDVLAQAFAAEDVDTLFTLMGDANMYWSAAMADNQQVSLIRFQPPPSLSPLPGLDPGIAGEGFPARKRPPPPQAGKGWGGG